MLALAGRLLRRQKRTGQAGRHHHAQEPARSLAPALSASADGTDEFFLLIKTACFAPRRFRSADLAARSGHAFLLLFQRHPGAALQGLRRRAAQGLADRVFGQGQWQSGGAQDPGEAGRGRRCGLGRRIEEGARRRHPADKIVFSGVGKTRDEMHAGAGRRHLPVQCRKRAGAGSAERVALAMGKRAPVTLRINPDVDARTHAKITTGTAETKFGIPFAPCPRGLCRSRGAERHRDCRRRCAYRQPDHRA